MKQLLIISISTFIFFETNAQQLFEFKNKADKKFDLQLPEVKMKSIDASKVSLDFVSPPTLTSIRNEYSISTLPLDNMPCLVPNTNFTNGILVYEPTQTMRNTTNHMPNAVETKTIKLKAIVK